MSKRKRGGEREGGSERGRERVRGKFLSLIFRCCRVGEMREPEKGGVVSVKQSVEDSTFNVQEVEAEVGEN